MINGRVGAGYDIKNGVKQGDALSCSLFILSIEPILRNIKKNVNINCVESVRLNYTWPKAVAYADDIIIISHNETNCVQGIFDEYQCLRLASGLKLNADQTEKFDIYC